MNGPIVNFPVESLSDDPILDDVQMEGMPPLDKAKRAINHVLGAITQDEKKWYLLGPGSQTFALLTEAAAAIFGKAVRHTRELAIKQASTLPPHANDNVVKVTGCCMFEITDHMSPENVVEFIADLPVFERMELMQRLNERFCRHCGGDNGASIQCGVARNGRSA